MSRTTCWQRAVLAVPTAVRRRPVSVLLLVTAFSCAQLARAESPAARDALGRGDCAAAGSAVNDGLGRDDAEAYYLAGFMYDSGRCVEADPARAARLYQRAASLGSGEATAGLALLTALGRGVPQDYAAAHRLFHADKPATCDVGASADALVAIGYAETIARLAWPRVKYPLSANANALEASIDVVVSPGSDKVELEHVHVEPEVGSRLPRTHDFTEPIEAAYHDAQKLAPRPAPAVDAAVRVVTPWRFVIPRDVNHKKVRLEGVVTLGDVCLVP